MGDYMHNKKNGRGRVQYQDGTIFEGNFKDDRPNGFGKMTSRDYTYEGSFVNGLKNGNGNFLNNKRNFNQSIGIIFWSMDK